MDGDPCWGCRAQGQHLPAPRVSCPREDPDTALRWLPTCACCRRRSMAACTAHNVGSRAAGERARSGDWLQQGDEVRGGLLSRPGSSSPSVRLGCASTRQPESTWATCMVRGQHSGPCPVGPSRLSRGSAGALGGNGLHLHDGVQDTPQGLHLVLGVLCCPPASAATGLLRPAEPSAGRRRPRPRAAPPAAPHTSL